MRVLFRSEVGEVGRSEAADIDRLQIGATEGDGGAPGRDRAAALEQQVRVDLVRLEGGVELRDLFRRRIVEDDPQLPLRRDREEAVVHPMRATQRTEERRVGTKGGST